VVLPPDKGKRRSEESLEVGLGRHRKRRMKLPPWLEERLGWIGVVGLIVLFGLPIQLMLNVSGGVAPPDAPPTRLILTFGPAKVWKEGTASHLKSATIKVKNVGSAPALGVQTAIHVRSHNIALSGPDRLEPGAEATYSGEANVSVLEKEQIDVSFGCLNCQLH
jgi:hypothetical protein